MMRNSNSNPLPPAKPTGFITIIDKSCKDKNTVVTGITINWADNSENEGLYVVEGCKQHVKRKGKKQTVTRDFREVGSIAVGKTSVIKFIVYLEAAYNLFRVKAVNDNCSSAWSN